MTFDELYEQRSGAVQRYVRVVLGVNASEDVCQEAWLKAWRAWDVSDVQKVDAWLMTIVRNCCFDRMRANRPTVALVDERLDDEGADRLPRIAHDDKVASALDLAAVWVVLQKLTPPLREVLWLREVLDLTYAEIAEIQDVPLGTVMSRLHTARRKAARHLKRSDLR